MSRFSEGVLAGAQEALTGDLNFGSEREAMVFFQDHWDHGATNYGDLYGTIECEHCGQSWTYTGFGRRSLRQRRSRAYGDDDRKFL